MKADRVFTLLNIKVCLARVVWLSFNVGISKGLFSICNLLCICIIDAFDIWAPFAFLHFTTVNFPVQTWRVPGFFYLCVRFLG
jgi:hypothetical protein